MNLIFMMKTAHLKKINFNNNENYFEGYKNNYLCMINITEKFLKYSKKI